MKVMPFLLKKIFFPVFFYVKTQKISIFGQEKIFFHLKKYHNE